MNLDLNYAA